MCVDLTVSRTGVPGLPHVETRLGVPGQTICVPGVGKGRTALRVSVCLDPGGLVHSCESQSPGSRYGWGVGPDPV